MAPCGRYQDIINLLQNQKVPRAYGIWHKAYEFRKFCDKDNTLNLTEMWNMKKKLWPKKRNHLPMAKRNHQGKIVSAPNDLRKLLLKEYKERLRPRPCHPKLKVTQRIRKKVINFKLKIAMRQKSQPFKMGELE